MDIKATTPTTNTITTERRSDFGAVPFWLLVLVLAWAPFPLGSNRPWSWSLLCLLVALVGLAHQLSVWRNPLAAAELAKFVRLPLLFGALTLIWAEVQIAPFVPRDWAHPVWQMANEVLTSRVSGKISLSPWRTETELMKLLTYASAAWLSFVASTSSAQARRLLDAMIFIGGAYAVYALVLGFAGLAQFNVFYVMPAAEHDFSGPFVNRNSFATYAGLVTLCAGARFFERAGSAVSSARDRRRLGLLLTRYVLGPGLPYLIVAVAALAGLIATGSRAGNAATLIAVVTLLAFSWISAIGRPGLRWIPIIMVCIAVIFISLFMLNSAVWTQRLDDMTASGIRDDTRVMLWSAAWRMIKDAPILGLGLGTYEVAYPLYSDRMLPFIMDRAHNDWLELAAGLGLAASLFWWSAIGVVLFRCARGFFERRKDRIYPLLAIGASVLVGFHALFDFSLQMPSIALFYAVLLGLGAAQAISSERRFAALSMASAHIRRDETRLRIWTARLAPLGVIGVISGIAIAHLWDGLAQEAAARQIAYMKIGIPLSADDYRAASAILSHASNNNGEVGTLWVEAQLRGGAPLENLGTFAEGAAGHAPAQARAWLAVAETEEGTNPTRAAAAVQLALELAPHEYYLMLPMLEAAAPIWEKLPKDAQRQLVGYAVNAVDDPRLRVGLAELLRKPGARALISHAFDGRPDALRAFNRRLTRERLGL